MSQAEAGPRGAAGPARPRTADRLKLLDRPLTSYYLLIGTTGLLLAIGLVMVLSTSSASQLDAGGSPYSVFAKQLMGAAAGLAVIVVLVKLPTRLMRAVAYPLLLGTIAGLALVLAFGTTAYGAERWITVGPVQVQPSEFAKLALLLWGADLLARKEQLGQLRDARTLLVPLLPGAAILAMLVMLGDDLGTTFVLLVILLALLWVIGTPTRLFAGILGMVLFALVVLVIVQPYRLARLTGYLSQSANPVGQNQQGIQGKWALGSGGLFGVGLGNSKEKWGWVPNATNDFIFAILGEELGLIGTVCVVLLYGGFAYAGLRVARRMTDPFMRLAAAGATAWIVIQALVNISAVVGLLPITGVPLPLVSAGLSSLLASMAAIGMLLSFARNEPGAREALAAVGPRWRWRRAGTGPPAAARPDRAAAKRQDAVERPGSVPSRPAGRSRLADPAGARAAAGRTAVRAGRANQDHRPAPPRAGPPRRAGQDRAT
ncbi:MAG TPA: putative lipid II flippase FtsW [Streptosporangiaceae bacterium]